MNEKNQQSEENLKNYVDQKVGGGWNYLAFKYDESNLTQRVDEALKDEKFRYITRYGSQVLYTAVTKLAIMASKLNLEPFLTSAKSPYGMTKPLPDMQWIEEDLKNPDVVLNHAEERKLHLGIEKASMYPLLGTMIPFILAEAAEVSEWVHGLYVSALGEHAAEVAIHAGIEAGLGAMAILQWGMVALTAFELSHALKKSTLEGFLEDRVNKLCKILDRLDQDTPFSDEKNLEKLLAQKNEIEKEINSALNIACHIVKGPENNKENNFEWSDQPITQDQVNKILEPLNNHYANYPSFNKKVNVDWMNPPQNSDLKLDKLRVRRCLLQQRRSASALTLSLFGYIALAVGATLIAAMTLMAAPAMLPVLGTLAALAPKILLGTGVVLNLISSISNRFDRKQSHLEREQLFMGDLKKLLEDEKNENSPRALLIKALEDEMNIEVSKRQKDRGVLPYELMDDVKNDDALFKVLDEHRKAWPSVLKNTLNWNTQKEELIGKFTQYREKCVKQNTEMKNQYEGLFFKSEIKRKSPEEMKVLDDLEKYFKTGHKEIFCSFSNAEKVDALSSLRKDKQFCKLIEKYKFALPEDFTKPWNEVDAKKTEESMQQRMFCRM